jgi:asparagine synthase (glutamine-hydrolysing)
LKHVRKLPPGHLIRASRRGFSVDRWYEPPIGRAQGRLHIGDAVREVREEFRRAVTDQCLSDVPIGAFLSGGVDSSAIVAAMVRSGHRPERAYCVGFAGPSMVDEGFGDDLAYARMMARRLDLRLEEIRVSAPEPEDLESLAWTLDEPQADPAALYVGGIAQAARSHGIKVLLSGAGGDDVFTGYRRHKAAALRARLGPVSRLVSGNNRIIGRLSGSLARRIGKLAYLLGGSDRDMLLRAFEFNRRSDAELCLSKDAKASALADDGDALERAVDSTEGAPLVERMLHLEWHGFLPDHNLNYTDKAAMAHGVEVRVPFLANRLIEASSRIPWQFKTRSLDEKWILKKAVAEDVPAAILRRKKTGFGAPVRQWIMHGQLRAMAEDVLASRSFETRGLFDVGAARRVLADTIAGRRDGAYLVLALVMVEFWLRRFTDVNSASVRQMVPN